MEFEDLNVIRPHKIRIDVNYNSIKGEHILYLVGHSLTLCSIVVKPPIIVGNSDGVHKY